MALATAGSAPTLPASPAPFTPSGLVLVGTGLLLLSVAMDATGGAWIGGINGQMFEGVAP